MPRERLTNAGKKETRQFDALLNKQVKEGRTGEGGRQVAGRTVTKQPHRKTSRKGAK